MAPKSCTWQSSCINSLANLAREQNKLAGQGPVREFNIKSNKASTEAFTPLKAPTLSLVPPSTKNFFIKFMKVLMKMTQTQAQTLAKLRKQLLKAWTLEIYWGKSYMECYHFCQQCEDYFKTFGTTGMNHTPFKTSFFHGSISIRQA